MHRPSRREKDVGIDDQASQDTHGVHKGQLARIPFGLLCGLADQAVRNVAGERDPVDLLKDWIGRQAALGDASRGSP